MMGCSNLKKRAKKLLLYIGGLLLVAIGVNISKTAMLGISPVSAIPYALELISGIELGKTTLIFNISLILLQIIILRGNYKAIQLLQIVCTYLFGFFISYTSRSYLLFWLPLPTFYLTQIAYLLISIIIIGIGISFYLLPGYVPLPAEGLVKAIVELSGGKMKFPKVKVYLDTAMVLISGILSLIFLGKLKSVREGTLIAAVLIGKVVGFIYSSYKPGLDRWISKP